MSDRVVVMMGGKVIQEGSPKDLYDRPKFREVAAFLGDMNFFEGSVRGGRLVTPGGLVLDAPGLGAREGQATIVAVRPERISLHLPGDAGASPGHNQVRGTLVATDYSGSVTRYKIELADGTSALADRTADQDFLPEDASELVLSWSGSDCVILEGEGRP
jgi:ABC-type Fe3+/spermidine/putrescine transport system ATPase subunit